MSPDQSTPDGKYPSHIARSTETQDVDPDKPGRFAQVRTVFTVTRAVDPAVLWYMLLTFVVTVVVGVLIGLLIGHLITLIVPFVVLGLVLATLLLFRRAERAAYQQYGDQPGVVRFAMQGLRRGWTVDKEPVAVDPRTQDLVFRALGRPGIVLVTEGPVPRVNRLVDTERKRMNRILPDVPVIIVNAGDQENQIPLRKVSRTIMRKRPVLTKDEVSTVSKRLRALGGVRPPIPQGIDPTRMRPDRRATKGR